MAAESTITLNMTALVAVVGYYFLINIIMYIVMSVDKRNAIKNRRRVPEKNLYLLAILGGGTGGLFAMVLKHHKNRHLDFILVYTITAILHFIVILFLFRKLVFGF